VTISTAGVVPQILKLANDCNVALAVSLHAPTNDLRDKLVPINKVHPIAELLEACWKYAEGQASRSITFEYVLLDGVNDSVAQARELVKLLRNRPAKVNLIPHNPAEPLPYQPSAADRVESFREILESKGVYAFVRKPRGRDILAACGQLAARGEILQPGGERDRDSGGRPADELALARVETGSRAPLM
jgi:23S rRNA (adenine2503-C2)-methyltransferase